MELVISGKTVLIDDEDYEKVSFYKWHISGNKNNDYVVHTLPRNGKKRPMLRMHRFIIDAPDGTCVDHINGNRYDNRKSNLRLCTQRDNSHNTKMSIANTSGLKGASFHKASGMWQAQITINRKVKYLGIYKTAFEAHAAYKEAAEYYYGEFMNLGYDVISLTYTSW